MKKLCIILGLLSLLELYIIFGLYLRIGRLNGEMVKQQIEIENLATDLHQILNDKDICNSK